MSWRSDAGRFYLDGRPVHAGDAVELNAVNWGRWVRGRIETENGGRVALFYHNDAAMPNPVALVAAVAPSRGHQGTIRGGAFRWPAGGR